MRCKKIHVSSNNSTFYQYESSKEEDQAIKKQVKDIITKWSRILLEMPSDYTYRRDTVIKIFSVPQKVIWY